MTFVPRSQLESYCKALIRVAKSAYRNAVARLKIPRSLCVSKDCYHAVFGRVSLITSFGLTTRTPPITVRTYSTQYTIRVHVIALASSVLLALTSGVSLSYADRMSHGPEGRGPHQRVRTPTPRATPTSTATPTPRCVPVDCRQNRVPSRFDVNFDCHLNSEDTRLVQNALGNRTSVVATGSVARFDVTRDGFITSADVWAISSRLTQAGCSPTPVPTPTATSAPTRTPTPRPTPTPPSVPTPTPRPCVYVAAWGPWSTRGGGLHNVMQNFQYANRGPLPSCFERRFSRCTGGMVGTDPRFRIYGWCLAYAGIAHTTFFDMLGLPAPPLNVNDLYTFYMDANCRHVPNPSNADICGFGGAAWSPISLIFDDTRSLESEMRVVEFALAPPSGDKYALWKGSQYSPLLVFDPHHTGEVKDVRQLFGNYAFGGVTSNPEEYSTEGYRAPWRNGYEALALLDTDQDGEIRGQELNSLALWFDYDRNAKSSPGELRRATQEGVVSIRYLSPHAKTGSQDLVLASGFDRLLGSRIVTGQSVDWYAHTYKNLKQASDALAATFSNSARDNPEFNESKIIPSLPVAAEPIGIDPKNSISGTWIWSLDFDGGSRAPGALWIVQKGSVLSGYTAIETDLQDPSGKLAKSVRILPITGRALPQQANGNRSFEFEVKDVTSGSTAKSTIEISPDGHAMLGETSQRFVIEGAEAPSAEVQYKWVAERLQRSER